jgi:hypothetical protein
MLPFLYPMKYIYTSESQLDIYTSKIEGNELEKSMKFPQKFTFYIFLCQINAHACCEGVKGIYNVAYVPSQIKSSV